MNNQFWKATLNRAVRTIAQTATAIITASVAGNAFGVLSDVNWQTVVSASILAGILSVLTSISTGLPEVEYSQHIYMSKEEPDDSEVEDYEVFDYGDGEEFVDGEE
jgi:uncharacterized protein YqhQ